MKTLRFICLVLDKKDNYHRVILNSKEIREIPTKENGTQRYVTFKEPEVPLNRYYIVWNASLDEESREVTVNEYTILNMSPVINKKEEDSSEIITEFKRETKELDPSSILDKNIPPSHIPPKYS